MEERKGKKAEAGAKTAQRMTDVSDVSNETKEDSSKKDPFTVSSSRVLGAASKN